MRIVDIDWKELKDYDLTKGFLAPNRIIKPDAIPPDDLIKFAWDDEDYEEVLQYQLFPKPEDKVINPNDEKIAALEKHFEELQSAHDALKKYTEDLEKGYRALKSFVESLIKKPDTGEVV